MDGQTVSQEGFPTLEDFQENNGRQMSLFELQDLTIQRTVSLEKLNDDLKNAKEMYDSEILNSETYRVKELQVKESKKELAAIKNEVDKRPTVRALKEKMKDIRTGIKEAKEMLSECAQEIVRQSGKQVFEHNGQTYYVRTIAQVIKDNQ